MTRNLLHITLLPVVMLGLSACTQPTDKPEMASYTVRVNVEQGVNTDSAALFLVNDDYGKLQHVPATRGSRARRWTFIGQTSQPRIALLYMAGAEKPLHFILEPCLTEVDVNHKNTVIWGGKLCHYYHTQSARLDNMQNQLKRLRKTYNCALADSTLTAHTEAAIIAQTKRIHESRQKLLVSLMRRNDAVGALIRDQYFNQLDSIHLRQL